MAPLLLGIDIGTSRAKAMVVDGTSGAEVRTVSEASPFVTVGERTEATVDGLADVVRRLLARLGADHRRRVVGVGIAGMAESGAPLDAGGRALAPVLAWHDRRGESVAARLTASFGPDLERAIGHRLRYVSTVAKLGWLVEHRLVEAPARWLGVPELVLRDLTGAEATEWSLAARTGCFDVGRRAWLPDVARAAGFEVDVFPPVRRAGEVMGRVTEAAAAWSGLTPGVPVTIAGHDHLVGFVGSGASPADDLVDSVGTAETVVGWTATMPDIDAALAGGLVVTLFPGEGWAALTSAARAGPAIEATAATLGASPSALDGLVDPGDAGGAGVDAGGGAGLLDAPGLLDSLRRREPPVLPDGPPAEVWATLLDALAQETAAAAARVTGLLGPRRRLVVFGGGSASDPWLAAKARHIPMIVERTAVTGAVARGAALAAAVAAGLDLAPPGAA